MSLRLLQLCHDGQGAHRELAHCYAAAGTSLGAQVDTLFLREPPDAALAAAVGGHSVRFLDLPAGAMKGLKLPLQAELRRVFAELPVDLAICHRWKPLQGVLRLPPRLRPIKVLGVAHEMGLFARAGRRWWQRLRAPEMQVAGVSSAVVADLAATNPALPAAMLLPNAIDVSRARMALVPAAAARDQLGLPATGVLLGQVGRMHYKKQPLLALQAFALIAAAHPDHHLVYLGDGPERATVAAAAQAMGLADRVHITGWVPGAAALLSALDLLLLTSTAAEAFGLVLLEAMVAGCPLVVTDSPGPREVVADSGVVVPADADAIAAALLPLLGAAGSAGAARRAELATAGRVRVAANYDVPALAKRLQPWLAAAVQ